MKAKIHSHILCSLSSVALQSRIQHYEPANGTLHLIRELQEMHSGLHPALVLLLRQLPPVAMMPTHIAVAPYLTAYRSRADADDLTISRRLIGV